MLPGLDGDEQRRRWVAYSLFVADRLHFATYRERFGTDALADLPCLAELLATNTAVRTGGVMRLTPFGVERSDTIGPWLYSDDVRAKMRAFALR